MSFHPQNPSPAEGQKPRLPKINLLCRFKTSSQAFRDAVKKYFPNLDHFTTITIHECALAKLPTEVKFDAIVSPANSYGFMDGAFDDAISIFLSPNTREGYGWTTKKVQATLYKKWRGYAPPGSCTVVDIRKDSAWNEIKRAEQNDQSTIQVLEESKEHRNGCRYIALCPTMRVPRQIKWDREVVFECMWSLFCAIDAHNREANDAEAHIESILITPFGTGIGKLSEAKWAAQCVMAMKYWIEAVQNPDKWSNLQWEDVYDDSSKMLDSTDNL
jgi:O-acetyl-ADP-ribose deacetylase (regulator of RNase III)